MSFKAAFSLLSFCIDDLSVDVSRVLKSPTIVMLLSISPFRSGNSCLCFGVPMWVHIY